MAKDRYDYDVDYFLNGDSQFDGIFNNLTGMYQDYVHTDAEGRARIDHYITPYIDKVGTPDNNLFGNNGLDGIFQEHPEGMRGYIQAVGNQMGVKDLDQRIVAFNDVDHEDTAFDKEQQEALRQDMYAAYQRMSDKDKQGCSKMLQQNRDETTLTLELYQEEQLQDAMDWEHTGGYANGKFDIQEGYAAGGGSINEFGEIIRENGATLAGQSVGDIPTFTVPEGVQDMSGMFADKHVDPESAFGESARSELRESRIRQAESLMNDAQEKVGITTPQASSGDKTTVIMTVIKENEQGQKTGAVGVIKQTEEGTSFAMVGRSGSKKLPGVDTGLERMEPNTGHMSVPTSSLAEVSAERSARQGLGANGLAGVDAVGINGQRGVIAQAGQAGVVAGVNGVAVAGGDGQRGQAGVAARDDVALTQREQMAVRMSRRLNDPKSLAEAQSDGKIAEEKDAGKDAGVVNDTLKDENKKDRFKETFYRFRDLFDKSRSDEADFSK